MDKPRKNTFTEKRPLESPARLIEGLFLYKLIYKDRERWMFFKWKNPSKNSKYVKKQGNMAKQSNTNKSPETKAEEAEVHE